MVNISHVLFYLPQLSGLLNNTSLPSISKYPVPMGGNEPNSGWGAYFLSTFTYAYTWHTCRNFKNSICDFYTTVQLTYICICSGIWAQNVFNDMWPSPETLGGLKKQATESFYKLQELEEHVAKGSDVTNAFLELPATKAVITQATTALDSLEREAHKSFCNCINDPHMKDLAIQFQILNKQTSEALENAIAHPTALDAKERYNELSKQTTEAFAALISQSPAAKIVQQAVEQADYQCRNHPALCSFLVRKAFPKASASVILSLMFDKEGPRKRSWAAWVQSTVYRKMVPGEVRATMAVVALLQAQMKRDWSPEGCK